MLFPNEFNHLPVHFYLIEGQTWWDVVSEHHVAWEAGIDLALKAGQSMTATPPLMAVPRLAKTYDKLMQAHCLNEGISPTTRRGLDGSHRQIFSSTFNKTFQ